MKINVNKELLETIGKSGLKIGKQIIVEGTKVVAAKAAGTVVLTALDASSSIKDLTLDKIIGVKNDEIIEVGAKKKWYSKFKKEDKFDIDEDAIVVEAEEVNED